MAVDTPAKILVIGAGPIGLEAALYARFLGYEVAIYERGRVADHVRRWGHATMFTPWRMNVTSLGLAALRAQDTLWTPPSGDTLLTGREWAAQYLVPLSQTDLLADNLYERTELLAVARGDLAPGEPADDEEEDNGDDEPSFTVRLRDAAGRERIDTAEVVIDASGLGRYNALGPDGKHAVGEETLADRIERGLIELTGPQREHFQGRRVLLVGAGHSAATNALALAALEPRPQIIWITRRAADHGPLVLIPDDPLPERDRLARTANQLAADRTGGVEWRPGTSVSRLSWNEASRSFRIGLTGDHAGEIEVDQVIANVGQSADGPSSLVTREPDFYVLGAKSGGGQPHFLVSIGHQQIRDLFTIIGDRADLDLYKSMARVEL